MNETNITSNATTLYKFTFPPMLIAFMTLQQLVFVVACIGNGLVIFIFVRHLKFKSNTNKFIVSLAFADFFTGISCGTQMLYFFYPKMSSNMILCILRYQVITVMTLTSQLTVGVAAFDRYLAICHPHKYALVITRSTSNIMCILPWILPTYVILGPMLGWRNWYPGIPCSFDIIFPKSLRATAYIIVYIVSIITAILYLPVLKTAWRYYQRMNKYQQNQTRDHMQTTNKMKKAILGAKVTGIVTIAFSIFWLPYMTLSSWIMVSPTAKSKLESDLANWLVFFGASNSIVNPIIYAWKRPDVNQQFKKVFCGSKPVSHVEHIKT